MKVTLFKNPISTVSKLDNSDLSWLQTSHMVANLWIHTHTQDVEVVLESGTWATWSRCVGSCQDLKQNLSGRSLSKFNNWLMQAYLVQLTNSSLIDKMIMLPILSSRRNHYFTQRAFPYKKRCKNYQSSFVSDSMCAFVIFTRIINVVTHRWHNSFSRAGPTIFLTIESVAPQKQMLRAISQIFLFGN